MKEIDQEDQELIDYLQGVIDSGLATDKQIKEAEDLIDALRGNVNGRPVIE